MLTINLFDNSFRGDLSSTRWQTPTNFRFVRDLTKFDGPTLFLDGFSVWPIVDEVECPVKIAWLHEPPCLGKMHTIYNDIQHVSHKFSKVLTYDAKLLALDPHYRLQMYGGCWIDESEWGLRPKSKLCSMLIGDKLSAPGHIMRRNVADRLTGLVDFYGTRGEPVGYERGTKLRVNGDYMFTVITETCRMDHLVTEWTIDALAVGTIPVLCACPNVSDYFDHRGILSFETVSECEGIVKGLSESLYRSLLPYARDNLEAMRPYARPDDLMYEQYLREYDKESAYAN